MRHDGDQLIENSYRDEVALGTIENRGYSRGTGTLLLPHGRHIQVSHEEGSLEIANALARAAWTVWEKHLNDALDFLMGSGAPALSFPEIGTVHEGIVRSYEKKQQTDIDRKPKFYDNGDPMMQLVITLETEERDPADDDDDGMRRLFVKGSMLVAVRDAVKAAKHKGDIAGGKLAVKYVKDGKPTRPGYSAPKEFAAKFEPPAADPFGYDEEPF